MPHDPGPETVRDGATSNFRFGGYAKAMAIASRSADAAAERYTLAVNRLRLKLSYEVPSRLQVHVEHDTEIRAGSYLDTDTFHHEKNLPPRQYWSEGSVIADRRGYYATQRLFRAYVRLSLDDADLTMGRQRIPLGTGRLWSTLDMLNPINPLQVERDEYVGVDAALLDYKIGALSRISLVYAPDPARRSDRVIGQYRTNLHGADLAFTYGKYWDDRLAGVDVATQLGDAGLRGEFAWTTPAAGPSFGKVLLGLDYAFANTLSLSAEFHASSQSRQAMQAAFARNPQLAQVQAFGIRHLGLAASYDITPLFKTSAYFLFNLSDHSRFMAPAFSWSPAENLSISGGVQLFSGNDSSEYGRGRRLGYVQVQRYF